MHQGTLHMRVPGHPVALLSLGAVRRMVVRTPARPRASMQVELEPGSLLVMSCRSQLEYEHGIPKTPRPVGPRISLACRLRPLGRSGR